MLSQNNDEEQSNNKEDTIEYTLQGVIHFLQAEAHRYQRDRNNWEIEYAEMKTRIATLEGERKSLNKLKDLHLKRIKMLENSLEKERAKLKIISSPISSFALNNTLDQISSKTKNNKLGTQEKIVESNEITTHTDIESFSKLFSDTIEVSQEILQQSDKREKSLQFLEKCLQEITYLINSQSNISEYAPTLYQPNPIRSHISLHNNHALAPILSSINTELPSLSNKDNLCSENIKISSDQLQESKNKSFSAYSKNNINDFIQDNYLSRIHSESTILNEERIYDGENKKNLSNYNSELLLHNLVSTPLNKVVENNQKENIIYQTKESQTFNKSKSPFNLPLFQEHVLINAKNDDWDFYDDNAFDEKINENNPDKYTRWRTRFALKNHLASIRSVSACKNENTGYASMATCGDDGLVKLWRLPVNNKKIQNQDIVPQITYRGHSGIVTNVCIATEINKIFSAGIDSTIRCWKIPEPKRNIYAPIDDYILPNIFTGHSNAVWDLSFQSILNILASISADGTIKLWNISCIDSFPILSTLNFYGNDLAKSSSAVPTSITFLNNDKKKLAVSWNNAIIKIYDTEIGKAILELKNDEIYDGTNNTQINKIIAHTKGNILISGHENKYIPQCTYSMLAHLDAISSLDISPDGETLVSAGHDASVRLWDMQSPQTCIQEISNHHIKAQEGVNDISWWYGNDNTNQLEYIISVGGDGVIKVNTKN
ncbi:hypothetical protein PMAC_002562 [Pneumocystis sp. 'macacae']|nr:hypothetical protein PMAC_002562 [Pneumocystis sp. 'macacae']